MQRRPGLAVISILGSVFVLAAATLVPTVGRAGATVQGCDPNGAGCPLKFDDPASASLIEPGDAHIWWLTVPISGSFRLELTDLPANFRLYTYAPDGTLAGQVNNPGPADQSLDIAVAVVGEYAVFVDSPTGATSAGAYVLTAIWTGSSPIPVVVPTVPVSQLRPPPARSTPPPATTEVIAEIVPIEVVTEVDPALPLPTRIRTPEAAATVGPGGRFATPVPTAMPPTRVTVPTTCTGAAALTLERSAIRSDDAVVWEAHGFRPGSSVRAQAFAEGTQSVSDIGVSAVESDCTTGPGGEVVVQAVARGARYYILRVTGSRYGTGTEFSLIARFTVYTAR